jgi:hypothetical protein
MSIDELKPGQRVRVTQAIDRREGDWIATTEGVVESVAVKKTAASYAHSKDAKLWLTRLTLRKEDGEISQLVIDSLAKIELLEDIPA